MHNIRRNIRRNRATEILFYIVHGLAMILQRIYRPTLETYMKMDML